MAFLHDISPVVINALIIFPHDFSSVVVNTLIIFPHDFSTVVIDTLIVSLHDCSSIVTNTVIVFLHEFSSVVINTHSVFLHEIPSVVKNDRIVFPHDFSTVVLNVVKVGHKYLLLVGNNWNSFVKFRRLPGGHSWHIKRATCNILICLRNTVILRKSGGEKLIFFLNNSYLDIVDTMLLV